MTRVIQIKITSRNGAFPESPIMAFEKAIIEMRDANDQPIINGVDIKEMDRFDPPV